MKRKLYAGMVGGGRDAFIGGVHRMAMRLDGKIEIAAGAFSSSPQKAKLSGRDLLLNPKRVYADSPQWPSKRADCRLADGSTLYQL